MRVQKPMTPREIEELAEWLADEIKNPITAMRANGKRLEYHYVANSSGQQFEVSDGIKPSTWHHTLEEAVRAFEARPDNRRPLKI